MKGIGRRRSWAPATGASRDGPIARRTGRQPPIARTSPHSQSCGKAWYGAPSTNAFHAAGSVTRQARSSALTVPHPAAASASRATTRSSHGRFSVP